MVDTRSMKKKRKSAEANANNQTYSNLPLDLMLLIVQRLSLKDNIRASVVCKTWKEACVSVRVEDPTPCLMLFSSNGEEYELHDPSLDKTHNCKLFPELRGSHIECSADGWLLMHVSDLTKTIFFNPFTHERIELPFRDMWLTLAVAFSCAPTSDSCVIFSVHYITKRDVTVETYCLATKVCTRLTLPHGLPLKDGGFEHVVFSNGVFYCLNKIGWLGMFDLSTNSWNVLLGRPPRSVGTNGRFMTEYQGDIFLIYTNTHDLEPRYLKLDLANRRWTDKIRLGGLSFYFSSKSTLTTNRNLVYTQKMHQYCNWHVWIKPPINVSDLFKS